MKYITTIFTLLCFATMPYAQQVPLFSTNNNGQSVLNPGFLGINNQLYNIKSTREVTVSFRKQWEGIIDAPLTGIVGYSQRSKKLNMLGGFSLIKDRSGPTSINGGYFRYAYQFYLDKEQVISVGISMGMFQYRYKGDETLLRDANDIVGLENSSKIIADFAIGAYYSNRRYNDDIFFAALSIPQFATPKVSEKEGEEDFYVYRKQHFFGNVGYSKYIENLGGLANDSYLGGALAVRYLPHAPVQVTIDANLLLNELLWVGGGYAFSFGTGLLNADNIHFEVGLALNNLPIMSNQLFRVSYGLEISMFSLGGLPGNTHEMNLSFSF